MKTFKPYHPKQNYLLPPDMAEWLPEGHLAWFIHDIVDQLNLKEITASYEDSRGQPPYHPAMMVKLLVYAYCTGKPSSRKIEKATWEDVAYRVLAADQHPDHDSIASFRKRHLQALSRLFVEVLLLCQRAGLVKLGHVALDGSKVKANASKHKAMSYGRMSQAERKLQKEITELLKRAEEADAEEDAKYGKGQRGDELPKELQRRESRLKKIREAKAALEWAAKQEAEQKAKEAEEKIKAREEEEERTGKKLRGKPPKIPDVESAQPNAKAQRNFTDPESRIMKDGATKSFEQCYNAQIAVDEQAQVIVAAQVTQEPNDKKQLIPLLEEITGNVRELPEQVSADCGYFSETNVTDETLEGIDLYIPPDRYKHSEQLQAPRGRIPRDLSVADKMRRKLRTKSGQEVYRFRKAIVEPVFGQIKEALGFRRFSLRGLDSVRQEWLFVCLAHNLLKLFRSGWCP